MQCGDVPLLDQRILPDGLRDEAPYARRWLTHRSGEERAVNVKIPGIPVPVAKNSG
jgi:hypothetical protein